MSAVELPKAIANFLRGRPVRARLTMCGKPWLNTWMPSWMPKLK